MKRGERGKNKIGTNSGRRIRVARTMHLSFTIVLLLISASLTCAQHLIEFTYKSYGLEKEDDNVIHNAAYLEDFFEDLYNQKISGNRKISIIHIGDSHIQADFLTTIVRRNFQKNFGNAGRGLVVPARVAGTNEPFNIISRSNTKWDSKRITQLDQPLPIGVGGITIETGLPKSKLEVYMNDLWLDYSFKTLTLFFKKDYNSFDFSIRDTANHVIGFINSFRSEPFVNHSQVILTDTVSGVIIETYQSNPSQNHATIFGINLENGKNGVLYHAIGVNGAKYSHYNAAPYFSKQTSALEPQVFIISLGTNESMDYPYLDKNFLQHIDKLISSLRSANPSAKFILVTPPDAFRQKIKPNPGIGLIREQIITYAVENGLAFYDMYKALGGSNAAAIWRRAGLLRADGVHFTKEGYEYQGNLFFNALMKSYNQYVPLRHP
ncbi:GDSL-type esterase/lipase family protein [Chryseosolibacter indicus]|uniref:SGNH hydrolase-type esterase domain-containing protein n=1 Tax=Chryseosolibacter indicus TaxID=2782351 RepID=A0ABS5VU11_9BACT|nr:GDSL-type esterase/lipase family protein [Chryseosolibacter indicus]MBT1704254.1 hypothetical protein [Chryseosolibacter indicus]